MTFQFTTSDPSPAVGVKCYQSGKLVYQETNGFYAGAMWDQNFELGPTYAWTGGGANCTATLTGGGSLSVLGTLNFSVSA